MRPRLINICHADREWHAAFLRYVPRVFPEVSFEAWHEHGGWDDRYQTFSMVEGNEIVANASVHEMDLVLDGRPVRGWQLGAVGTLPTHRGRGLHRELMPALLELAAADDLVFLFANDSVLDFYPRFGFRREVESVFGAAHAIAPATAKARRLRVADADDRALVTALAANAGSATSGFGARNYGGVLLWYWASFYAENFFYLEDEHALVVADEKPGVLQLLEIASEHRFDLQRALPRLISAPIERVELYFTPDAWWPTALPIREYSDSQLFVLGRHTLPRTPFKFPVLAQT